MRILGIDPGSVYTGFAVLDVEGGRLRPRALGRWALKGRGVGPRLAQLHASLGALLQEYQPQVAAVETVFVHHNPNSALKLGQARGVILCTLAEHDIAVHEYPPATIKQSVCGSGRADKTQVGWMITRLLAVRDKLSADAADAAAVAVCHHQHAPARRLRAAALPA